MRSKRELHEIFIARTLIDYLLILNGFKQNFEFLFENFNLNMSLKVHIIIHHYQDYFEWRGKNSVIHIVNLLKPATIQ